MIEAELVSRVAWASAGIAALLFAAAWIARRSRPRSRAGARARRMMRVVETLTLPGATAVHAIEIGDACAIVARGRDQLRVVCVLEPATLAAWRSAG